MSMRIWRTLGRSGSVRPQRRCVPNSYAITAAMRKTAQERDDFIRTPACWLHRRRRAPRRCPTTVVTATWSRDWRSGRQPRQAAATTRWNCNVKPRRRRSPDNFSHDSTSVHYRCRLLTTAAYSRQQKLLTTGTRRRCKLTPVTRSPELCFYTLWSCDLTFQPQKISLVGYSKVIPCIKFEDFGIIRFYVRQLCWNT